MLVYLFKMFEQPNQAPKAVFNLFFFCNGEFLYGIGMADLQT